MRLVFAYVSLCHACAGCSVDGMHVWCIICFSHVLFPWLIASEIRTPCELRGYCGTPTVVRYWYFPVPVERKAICEEEARQMTKLWTPGPVPQFDIMGLYQDSKPNTRKFTCKVTGVKKARKKVEKPHRKSL